MYQKQKLIKITRRKNKEIVKIVEKMKNADVKVLYRENYQIEGDLVLKERKIYIPKDKVLRVEIIQLHHDIPVTRYSGRWKTTELVARSNKRYKICEWL